MDGWTIAWLIWLVMFIAIELPALLNKKPGDTFSETVWNWIGFRSGRKGWRLRRVVVWVFLSWLLVHLVTGAM